MKLEPSGFVVRAYKLAENGKPDLQTEHVERSRNLSYASYRRNMLRFREGYGAGEGMVFLGAEVPLNWDKESETYQLPDGIEMIGDHTVVEKREPVNA